MLDARTEAFISYKVSQLIGKYGFTEDDRNDLEQELILKLLQRLPNYNPERAKRSTFVARVLDHEIATNIEARKAQKRDYRLCICSLNDRITEKHGDSFERLEVFDQDDYLRRTGKRSRSEIELNELAIDVRRIMDRLPPQLRELCQQLRYSTFTEISRDTGIPKSTIYDRLKKLKAIFEDAGMKDYW